jgi:hypothetical protein
MCPRQPPTALTPGLRHTAVHPLSYGWCASRRQVRLQSGIGFQSQPKPNPPLSESKPKINDLRMNYEIDSVYECPLYMSDPSPIKEAPVTPF